MDREVWMMGNYENGGVEDVGRSVAAGMKAVEPDGLVSGVWNVSLNQEVAYVMGSFKGGKGWFREVL